MGKIEDLKNWAIGSNVDDENESNDDYLKMPTSSFETTTENYGFTSAEFANKQSQLVVFEPRSYSESQSIADHLKDRRGCVINLHRVSKEQATRIIDFLSGVIYAIEGDMQKVGADVFLSTPNNFGVVGEVSEEYEQNY
ncbi:MAG: cell division protein SepF [Bacilli bacterium]|jgi:cell division inhibitor SepF|nr:cell division protein SepF [Bacilli bacterium]